MSTRLRLLIRDVTAACGVCGRVLLYPTAVTALAVGIYCRFHYGYRALLAFNVLTLAFTTLAGARLWNEAHADLQKDAHRFFLHQIWYVFVVSFVCQVFFLWAVFVRYASP